MMGNRNCAMIAMMLAAWTACVPGARARATELPARVDEMEKLDSDRFAGLPDVRVPLGEPLADARLVGKTLVELSLMRNSIFAQCGFEFKTPWLRKYFKSRAWYPGGPFRREKLTEVDRANVGLIRKHEHKAQRPPSVENIAALTREEMNQLPDIKAPLGRPLTEADLRARKSTELKILRNSIFAQHGRRFQTKWLQDYFESRSWYRPGGYSDAKLNRTDRENIDRIRRVEDSKKRPGEAEILKMGSCRHREGDLFSLIFLFRPEHRLVRKEQTTDPYTAEIDTRVTKGEWRVNRRFRLQYRLTRSGRWKDIEIESVQRRECSADW